MIIDDFGNMIIPQAGKLILQLSASNKKLTIGKFNLPSKTLYLSRKREKHLHKKSNSYGFNYEMIKRSIKLDTVCLTDEYGVYKFPKQLILDEGKFLTFKQQGFERQIFLPLDTIINFKI